MEEDIKKILEENLEISRQSLKILKGIRRTNRISAAFKAFYWLVIIGSMVGVYYYLQPYLKVAMNSLGQIYGTFSEIQQTSESLKAPLNQGFSSEIFKDLSPDALKNLIEPR